MVLKGLGARCVKTIVERYILILLDVFFIREWCIRNGYCSELLRKKYGRYV